MEPNQATPSVTSDVLHFENQSRLSQEEIAKAIAHHNRHHHDGQPQIASAKPGANKKQGTAKTK